MQVKVWARDGISIGPVPDYECLLDEIQIPSYRLPLQVLLIFSKVLN